MGHIPFVEIAETGGVHTNQRSPQALADTITVGAEGAVSITVRERKRLQMRRLHSVLLLVWAAFLGGCALYVKVPMVRPAEVNISGIRKIGVLGLPPTPDVPREFSSQVTGQIVARLNDNGYFGVVERADLAQLASEVALSPDALFEGSSLARIGQTLGVDALIIGSVDSLRIQDARGIDLVDVSIPVAAPVVVAAPEPPTVVLPPPRRNGRAAAPVVVTPPVAPPVPAPVVAAPAPAVIIEKRPFHFINRTAELQMKLQLVRVSDGRVVLLQPISLASRVKAYHGPQPPLSYHSVIHTDGRQLIFQQLPPPEAFLSSFADSIPGPFVARIVPTRYTKTIEFANNSQADNKRGLQFAKSNAWDLAQQAFADGIAKDPGNAALHYNLGIVLEATGDLEGAGKAYQQALMLEPGRSLFQQTYRSLQSTIAEQAVLRRQTEETPR